MNGDNQQNKPRGRGGRGRGPGGSGLGPPGTCRCPQCGTEVPHQRGVPCLSLQCPKCGTLMVRSQ
ncbi:MAG: hypothetical protein RDV48_21385 [Candidatus Eremiobacteraeota bacterium]|nr:hypothetical protein [Candidatus Eremiobacteraeota bacterium]